MNHVKRYLLVTPHQPCNISLISAVHFHQINNDEEDNPLRDLPQQTDFITAATQSILQILTVADS